MEGPSPHLAGMFHKFALAFKTKTIELFTEDSDADEPPEPNISAHIHLHLHKIHNMVAALFAAVASFKAAYHQLQAAHAPLDAAAAEAADRAAVTHLARISEIKRAHLREIPAALPSQLEAEVQENQSLLRTFDMAVNRLQSEIDGKYAEACRLKQELRQVQAINAKMEDRLNELESSSPEFLLTVGLFRSVLLDVCQSVHRFTRLVVESLENYGCDLFSVADLLYPRIGYTKVTHHRYAFLSCVCLLIFRGFSSHMAENGSSNSQKRRSFLMQFVEHESVDAVELLERDPDCDFAKFCETKWCELVELISSLSVASGSSSSPFDGDEGVQPEVYDSFVNMASLVWMLHKLALAFDPPVRAFEVSRGENFSAVFMEPVAAQRGLVAGSVKVGFSVIPGFHVGKTAIQCQVYLDELESDAGAHKLV